MSLGPHAKFLLKHLHECSGKDTSELKALLSHTPGDVFAAVDLSGPECKKNGKYYNALQNFRKSFKAEGWLEEKVAKYCVENNLPAAAPDTAGTRHQAPLAAELLNQDRRRFAETVEQSRNVPQGAAPARVPSVAGVQAVAGDNASYEDMMKQLALGKAQLEFRSAEVKLQMNEQIAELRFETDAKLSAMKVDTQEQLNKNEIAISDNKVAISEVQVEQQHLKVEQQHLKVGLTNANERVDGLTGTVNGLTDTVKKMLLSNPANSNEGEQLTRLVGDASYSPTPSRTAPAAVDESDDNFDEVEVNNNIITPAPGPTSLASRLFPDDAAAAPGKNTFREFLRLLKKATRYGQDGKETEMDDCLKQAKEMMDNTELNEERNLWTDNFRIFSESARKRFSEYGLKPAAC